MKRIFLAACLLLASTVPAAACHPLENAHRAFVSVVEFRPALFARPSARLFVPPPAVVPQAMPRTAVGVPVAFRAVTVRTATKTVTRSAFQPLRTVGYLLTPWRW